MPLKKQENNLMERVISLCKRRGFIFPSSELYGGINSGYDYGPLGVELKNNIKREWWKSLVYRHQNIVGLDSSILMHPKVWEASGHVAGFTDPLVDCKKCKKRWRADHLLEAKGIKPTFQPGEWEKADVACPECGGELTEKRDFNLMFKTFMGPVEEDASLVYLRPETAQGIYVNFENVYKSTRQKIPFGVAQIGKAFRNEITPGNFIFRMREFEQMEMQWFCAPPQFSGAGKKPDEWFDHWLAERRAWYGQLGMKESRIFVREHQSHELAHYAKRAIDIEYQFPFGIKELEGVHHRGDWDLSRHEKFSGKDMKYFDQESQKEYIPWIVETSAGADRATLAFLADAYDEVKGGRTTTTESTKEEEVVLRLHKRLAPVKVAVLPLTKKEPLTKLAQEIWKLLSGNYPVKYDEVASIGRRYRRQDEIGTPYCVTVDFESVEDQRVTVRDRDTMEQKRVAIGELKDYLDEMLEK